MSKEHDNKFSLKISGLSNFSFDLKEHSITKGQPWDGVTTSYDSGSADFIVKAGRKNSDTNAKWFIEKLNGGSCLGNSSSGSVPGSLNFAFIGTMSFSHGGKDIVCENVLIGQGHSTRNTWWLGGPKMSGMDTPVGGMIKSTTNSIRQIVTFAELVGYISHMDMGVISI